jgi:NAD(P)-dependent dehydrogenase (short-subunit alcohol dehydrogenase family)
VSRLKNKVAVITGGNSGIGFGVAVAFKNEGAKGVIVGRNQETLDSSVAQLEDNFILIGSNAAHRAYPSFTLYGAAKAAVIFFAKAFSSDLLGRKIRANVITPGTTDTPAFEQFVPAEQIEAVKRHFADAMPIGRIGQPSDIGKAAVFLASDDSSFILGAEILVDGGMTYLSK